MDCLYPDGLVGVGEQQRESNPDIRKLSTRIADVFPHMDDIERTSDFHRTTVQQLEEDIDTLRSFVRERHETNARLRSILDDKQRVLHRLRSVADEIQNESSFKTRLRALLPFTFDLIDTGLSPSDHIDQFVHLAVCLFNYPVSGLHCTTMWAY